MVFKIVGTIENDIEAIEVENIAKTSIIAERGRLLGRIAFEEAEALRKAEEFVDFEISKMQMKSDDLNSRNNESFLKRLIFNLVRPSDKQ